MSLLRKKNIQDSLNVAKESPSLRRELSAFDLTLLGIGAIIGAGIFVLTGKGAVTAGPALSMSFVLSGLICLITALCYAEFASTIPIAGSAYTYTYVTLGEFMAWLVGWCLVSEYTLVPAAVSVGWSGYFQNFLRGFGVELPHALTAAYGTHSQGGTWFNLPAFCIVIFVTWILALGVRESKKVNNIAVIIKISVILLFLVTAIFHVKPDNWIPFMPFGWDGVVHGAALIIFSYLGFDAVSCAAEEVKNPARDLPIGIIASLIICSGLYVAVTLVMTGIVPFPLFDGIDHPISFVLQYAGLKSIAGLIDLGAILGMTTVILVMMYGQTRIFLAMSRDGLLPSIFSQLSVKRKVPYRSTWLIGFTIAVVSATLPLGVLAEIANIGTLSAFSMIALSVVILRRTQPNLPRKFICPGVPYLPIVGIIACLYLMTRLSAITWTYFITWTLLGLVIYFSYSRRHAVLARAA